MIWQMTVGDLVTAGAFISSIIWAYYAIRGQLDLFKQTLEMHAKTLIDHSRRMDQNESRLLDVVGELQRLIGRTERFHKDAGQ